jgi:hypothetical protein
MNFRYAVFAISLSVIPSFAAAAAEACKPRVLHSLQLATLRDSRAGLPVMFGATPGLLVIDSAGVTQSASEANRKSVPVSGGAEGFTSARTSYAGIAGTLSAKTVDALGLTANETGVRYTGAASGKRERKVSVRDFAIQGLSPFATEFLLAESEGRVADFAGTFSINSFSEFSFDLDLDFPGRTVQFRSREACGGPPADWPAASIASVRFTLDGNGFFKLPVIVDGKTMQAILDTGSVGTTLDFGYAAQAFRVKDTDPTLTPITQTADGRAVYSRPFTSIGFEGVTVADPTLILIPGIRGRSEGAPTGSRVDREKRGTLPPLVLGMSVLRQMRVYFDFVDKIIHFARSEAPKP